jgi:hypothetical protein
MAKPRESPLLAWALGSFHASFFVLILILVLVTRGGLGSILSGLNTLMGFALFGLLWTLAWWATRRGLKGFDFSNLDELDLTGLLGRSLKWGGVAGVLVLLGLALVVAVNALAELAGILTSLTTSRDTQTAVAVVGLIATPIAAIVAYIIGTLIGGILGTVDAMAVMAVRALLRASGPSTIVDE